MKVPEVKRGASQRQVEAEWMTTTCNHALYAMMDVFTEFFEVLSPILLADIFHQLQWCVLQDNEQLARSGTNCLENLVVSNGAKFSPEIWSATCECMYQIFTSTLPHELLTWSPPLGRTPPSPTPPSHSPTLPAAQPGKPPYAINSLLIRFIVQMELITCIDNIVFFPAASRKEDAQHLQEALAASSPVKNSDIKMAAPSSTPSSTSNNSGMYPYLSSSHLFRLAECLMESHKFARKFNSNHELRNALWKSGLRGNSKPNLARQETHSLACVTRILFRLLQDPQRRPEDKARAEILLVSLCSDALEYFLTLSNDSHREAWHPLLLLILSKTLRLSPEAFKRAASAYFPFLCDLVRMTDAKPDLRALLSKLLRRAGRVYGIHPRTSEGERRRRCSL
ncbi:unnamed protein product [Cyprideis torosa]|uniref:Sec7/BIG1-like C-terminal domain-containing protein n=1 Tax=Cyprideis torosa TaxID=163714 RepID=A0A7R8ZUT7_9CRUS|nr:unnamed protein product [Cyprideis torosa]CAG0906597.1 unnamed protein product [Cyprideis torosa]